VRLHPLDRGPDIGDLIGVTYMRSQSIVRADAHLSAADEMADQRPRFTVLVPEWKPPPWKCTTTGTPAGRSRRQ
jgi:hypothetical protein